MDKQAQHTQNQSIFVKKAVYCFYFELKFICFFISDPKWRSIAQKSAKPIPIHLLNVIPSPNPRSLS